MIVYKATNRINGKVYIGLTTKTIKERKKAHINDATNRATNKNYQNPYYLALRKHGVYNFYWRQLIECSSIKELYDMREFYIKHYNSMNREFGYNCTNGAMHFKFCEETKKKTSESLKGENSPFYRIPRTQEAKDKISKALSGENHPNYGKKFSEKTKQKMRKNRRDTHGKNNPMWNKHHSEETKEKLRQASLKYWEKQRA